jgi:hypothetical protein
MGNPRMLTAVGRFANIVAYSLWCGNNSVVECNLAKVEVAGSNPVSRSKIKKSTIISIFLMNIDI